jgi:catechol 2,3-dioxygenase-like lactoylglutathione lyase family enzyme
MSTTEDPGSGAGGTAGAGSADMKLEVVTIPVSDVDRAKAFYSGLGWRLDKTPPWVVQFTPPGSGCSVQFGPNLTSAAPGSAQRLYLIVSDIEAARDDLVAAGVEVSDLFHPAMMVRPAGRIPSMAVTARSPPSAIRTATGGCSRRSPPACRAESTP